jgi:predicted restriction endonuclease
MMEVTPHLGISTIVWSSIPMSEEDAKSKLKEAFRRLRPLYDFVKETIGDLQTVTRPKVTDYPDALTDIANAASISDSLTEKDRDVYTKARIGQGVFRERLVTYWERCSVTGCEETSILIASHIKPWRNCTVDEAKTMTNGLLLIPNLDSLFDKGFISFDNDGAILLSPQLSSAVADQLGVKKSMCLRKIIPQHQPYLEFHRANIFRKTS